MSPLHIKPLLLAGSALLSASALCATEPYRDSSLPAEQRASDLLSRLTLEEKIGLMTNESKPVERLGIPAYNWWNEALHGVARAGTATVFPQAIAMAATFDDQGVYEVFDMVSDEARVKYNRAVRANDRGIYKGLTFWTPNINIFRDPRWGRGQETYGEDPYLTSRMGVAVIKGLQGNGEGNGRYDKLHACAKHFAVHSGPEWNRHTFNATDVYPSDLWSTYLPAFEAAVKEADVKQVMCAYNRFEGEPCCSNNELLRSILRDKWGYEGVVVSDCGALNDLFAPVPHGHGVYPTPEDAGAAAVLSGTDLECDHCSYPSLMKSIEKGLVSETDIDRNVLRLLTSRFRLGNLYDDEKTPWWNLPDSLVACASHRKKALEMARKGIVLMSNRNNTLPISRKVSRIAIVGPNANDSVMLWGNYKGTPKSTVTLLEGICDKFPDTEVSFYKGCDLVSDENAKIEETAALCADSDVIIFAGGLSPKIEGEEMKVNLPGFRGGDRTSIELPEVQERMVKALKATGKPVVFVLFTGGAVAMPWVAENCDAVITAFYPGEAGGTALADVLAGDYNPSGRLPVTFYASTADLPDYEDYSMDQRTYRYFTGKPLYPFGHGLSYTRFKYGKGSVKPVSDGSAAACLTIPLSNVGKTDGDEVVQVYIRDPKDQFGPIKTLRAFRRVSVGAGRKTEVEFMLPESAFASYDREAGAMTVRPGEYEILYGGTSADSGLKRLRFKLTKK